MLCATHGTWCTAAEGIIPSVESLVPGDTPDPEDRRMGLIPHAYQDAQHLGLGPGEEEQIGYRPDFVTGFSLELGLAFGLQLLRQPPEWVHQ